MTGFFRGLGLFFLIPFAITLIYDLVDGWFVHNQFKLRNLQEWWNQMSPSTIGTAKDFLSSVTSSSFTSNLFEHYPACVVMLAPALFFYLLYRVIFLLQGGKAGGYKSRY